MFALFVCFLSLLQVCLSGRDDYFDLTSDRMASANVWSIRATSVINMHIAYATVVNSTAIFHTVKYAGDFGPGIIAEEYDKLVTNLIFIIGFNPVVFNSITFDPSTTAWVGTDILKVDYSLRITNGFIGNGQYIFNNQEFRFQEFIRYDPGSALINLGYTIQDPGADTMFTLTSASFDPATICFGFIFPACNVTINGTNYLADTGFSTPQECVAFLSSLPATQPCPYTQRSNTSTCRALHALSSFFLPQVHCSHVRRDSMVCMEACLPACSNCDVNAECVDVSSPPVTFSAIYQCKCKNGYVGNGTFCQPKTCGNGNNACPASRGSYNCSTGLCMCTSSFINNPTATGNDLCSCPSPKQIFWRDGASICLPPGRCIDDTDRYMCNLQNPNQVKCLPVENAFNPLNKCACNYGFSGGWEYPCSCQSPRRQLWSPSFSGFVCLNSTECTTNYPDCVPPQTCHIPAGQKVGSCS